VSLEGAAILGDRSARVVLIQYSDFECPFCARFARDTLPGLKAAYVRTGQLLVAFRHMPLPNHPFAHKAGEGAECAADQGKFWEMHDQLFKAPGQLDEDSLRKHARALGMDGVRFDDCLTGRKEEKVRTDALQARSVRITSTPTFFVGSMQPDGRVKVVHRFSGAQPASAFEAAIAKVAATAERTTGSSK
jgi:protein-disulfide isomerase